MPRKAITKIKRNVQRAASRGGNLGGWDAKFTLIPRVIQTHHERGETFDDRKPPLNKHKFET